MLGATAVAALATLGFAATAGAATFTVNDRTDAALSNPAGTTCVSTDESKCTLRAAVQAADNVGGASTITLPADEYELTLESTAEDQPANGDLDIRGSATAITIDGAGAGETIINANHIDRAFAVQSGKTLAIYGVTVENGKQTGSGSASNSSTDGYGGAFLNLGTLTISECVLTGNEGDDAGGVIDAEGSGATSILDSTVEDNYAEGEGGVLSAYGGSVTLTGDTIRNNKSGFEGGAIYVNEGEPAPVEVSKTTISGNEAAREGGGLYLVRSGEHGEGSLVVSESTLSEDLAVGGGGSAIYDLQYGSLEVEDSTLSRDTAAEEGGAIWVAEVSALTVAGSTFDGDGGGASGGAIHTYDLNGMSVNESTFHGDDSQSGGAVLAAAFENTITASTFSDDEATVSGGAILLEYGRLNAMASTFSANKASNAGGAIFEQEEEGLQLTNDTFTGNEAAAGGALNLPGDGEEPQRHFLLLNDTIARNSATEGGGIQVGSYHYYGIENTIIALNTGGDCQSAGAEDSAAEGDRGGNIDSDGTCFSDLTTGDQTGVNPLLAPLGSYGGPTETLALLSGSPAVDGGVESPEACPVTDQRGAERTGGCDVGAYQGVYTPPTQGPGSGSGSGGTTTTTTTTTSKVAVQKPCRSTRSETIHWKVQKGVALKRILVTLDGRTYRTLAGGARRVDVRLAGLVKEAVTVRITGVSSSGVRYRTARVFHTCVPAKPGAGPVSDYLRRA